MTVAEQKLREAREEFIQVDQACFHVGKLGHEHFKYKMAHLRLLAYQNWIAACVAFRMQNAN